MSTEEIKALVKKVYAAYNQTLYKQTQEDVFTVWEDLLSPYDMTVVYEAFKELATHSTFMPNPGQIRKRTLEKLNGGRVPSAMQAWATLLTLTQGANTGVAKTVEMHECLTRTIAKLGAQAYSLSTNYDRDFFIKEYNVTVEDYECELMGKTY